MHISANIDDCAIIIDNFLEKNIFKKISNFNYQDVKIFGFYKSADKYLFLQDKVKTMEEVVDSDWGGETLIDTNRGLPLASIPKPNSLLAIKNGVKHRVCAVTGPVERPALQIRTVYHDE
jgi:hypothetical protein